MRKTLLSSVLILFVITCFGQGTNDTPIVSIIDPINGSVFDGEQVKISYFISGSAPGSVRISVDGRPVQLITDAQLGENTAVIDIPDKDCLITIVAQNRSGASAPATLNLIKNRHIFKPSLYVLAIGISNYDNPDLRLQFPAKDASDFTKVLIGQAGQLYESVDVKLLTDRRATAENIREGLHWLQTETTSRDIAMLYIAGHGVNNNVGDFFFMPVNANIDRINATCVGYMEIKNTVSAVAGKLLVFMDACHSGNVLGNTQQRAAGITQAVSELTGADNGPVVFTSSTGRQFSLESPEWNNGAFTKALVEGLTGQADYGNKTITVKSLDFYILQRVKELTQGRQAPTTIIPHSIPDFPIAVVIDNQIAVNVVTSGNVYVGTFIQAETPPQSATFPGNGMLFMDARKIYQDGKELKRNEVQQLMANTEAFQMYNKSIRRNKYGNTLLIVCGAIEVGIVLWWGFLYTILGEIDYISADNLVSWSLVATPFLITGVTMKLTSKNNIKQSVNIYNSGINRTGMDLKFGVTGNGVGLAINF